MNANSQIYQRILDMMENYNNESTDLLTNNNNYIPPTSDYNNRARRMVIYLLYNLQAVMLNASEVSRFAEMPTTSNIRQQQQLNESSVVNNLIPQEYITNNNTAPITTAVANSSISHMDGIN